MYLRKVIIAINYQGKMLAETAYPLNTCIAYAQLVFNKFLKIFFIYLCSYIFNFNSFSISKIVLTFFFFNL